MERLKIDTTADTGLKYEETPLSILRDKVDGWIEKYGTDARFCAEIDCESLTIEIRYQRDETDDEFSRRTEKLRRDEEQKRNVAAALAKLTPEEVFALRSAPARIVNAMEKEQEKQS